MSKTIEISGIVAVKQTARKENGHGSYTITYSYTDAAGRVTNIVLTSVFPQLLIAPDDYLRRI